MVAAQQLMYGPKSLYKGPLVPTSFLLSFLKLQPVIILVYILYLVAYPEYKLLKTLTSIPYTPDPEPDSV